MCVCVSVRGFAEVCFDCVFVMWFIMGYVFQSGEIVHLRVHYHYYSNTKSNTTFSRLTPSAFQSESAKQRNIYICDKKH